MKTLIVRSPKVEGFFIWLKKELIFAEFKDVQPCLHTQLAFKCGYGLVPFEDVTMVTDMERQLMPTKNYGELLHRYGVLLESAVYAEMPDTMTLLYPYLSMMTQRERDLNIRVYHLEQNLKAAKEFLDKTFVQDREALFINPGSNSPMIKVPSPLRKSLRQTQEAINKEMV